MSLLTVVLLLGVLPIASVGIEYGQSAGAVMELVGKWFTFWAVGVRLLLAGARQILQPGHSAQSFFQLDEPGARRVVQELGFANLALGLLGVTSLWLSGFRVPAALAGAIYYGLAGARQLIGRPRSDEAVVATVANLVVCVILAIYLLDLAAV